MTLPIIMNWSGGKDSALALHRLLTDPLYTDQYHVVGLLTSSNQQTKKSSLHGIPSDLLAIQAQHIGLPIDIMYVPDKRDLATYEHTLQQTIRKYIDQGIYHFAFGDIHLDSVKNYRELQINPLGAHVIEPLWRSESPAIMARYLELGFKAITMALNAKVLDATFLGQLVDQTFITSLPDHVDCCGENGEYHTFCFDGPIFKSPVPFSRAETMLIEFPYQDEDNHPQISRSWQLPLRVHDQSI